MPQGKVIAVTPPGFKTGAELEDSTEVAADSTSSTSEKNFVGQLVFIELDEKLPSGPKIKNVVCYNDKKGEFVNGDPVKLDFNDIEEISIGLVKNVVKQ